MFVSNKVHNDATVYHKMFTSVKSLDILILLQNILLNNLLYPYNEKCISNKQMENVADCRPHSTGNICNFFLRNGTCGEIATIFIK